MGQKAHTKSEKELCKALIFEPRGLSEMPIYEYECTECGKTEEVLQGFSDKPVAQCKHCSGKLQKLISQSTFHLKGTGWYVTDYANKSTSSPAPPKNKEETSTTDKEGSKKTDDKS